MPQRVCAAQWQSEQSAQTSRTSVPDGISAAQSEWWRQQRQQGQQRTKGGCDLIAVGETTVQVVGVDEEMTTNLVTTRT